MASRFSTADLCDGNPDVLVAEPAFRDYGGVRAFAGRIHTVRVHEDNALVRSALLAPGEGCVLVVDGGGSTRTALLGDQLAGLAHANGWTGVVIHGCIRDAALMAQVPLGVKAYGTCPRKSAKRCTGDREVPLTFAGITFTPGHYLYADEDGVLVSVTDLM